LVTIAFMKDRRGLDELTEEECMRRLGRGGVGRVAVTVNALPAIFPVNFAVLDGDIVFRSGPGTKLTAATAGSVVAFEVDHSDPISHEGWSVMVVGPSHRIADPLEQQAVRALPLRSWAPATEDAFIRIEGRIVTGRQITHEVPAYAGAGEPDADQKGLT
jgi:nitroimidazol reductase NimA-like FMN-containing flavoprotein (pyridoxamine 5'-phosphate oxidase superfamily)